MNLKTDNDSLDSIPNEKYESDMKRTIQYTRWLFGILGLWPMVKEGLGKIEIYTSKLLLAACSFLMAFNVIPSTLHVIFNEKDPVARLMLFAPIGFGVTNILKYCSIIFRRETIKRCIEHIEADWISVEKENELKIMRRNQNSGRSLTALCAIFMYTGGFSYDMIMPMFSGNTVNDLNETMRPVTYPGYDIFVDDQSSPNYEIIFYTNCFSAFVTYTITTAACNLAAIFVTHACGQIDIMLSRLDSLFDDVDDKGVSVKIRVGFVVKLHVRVLKLTAMIETMLREICLVEFVASTLIICVLEYSCLAEWDNSETIAIITYFILVVSLSFNIFIFCYIGELLNEQCCEVGKATYMIEWYRLPSKTALALVMILEMTNYPRKLTAGGMMDLSVTSFGAIVKTSVVYTNMLRTV